jgi:hypothetical protein
MTTRAIYAYAWDVLDTGAASFVEEIRGLGLNTVTLAGSYHAGKVLRPHGSSGKVYFPEDGTVYFRADPARYGAIKPVPNSSVAERDVFRELCGRGDIAVNAWMVLLHNSRLGALHPGACVRNAFGDGYVYSLCPSAPEARDYAVALCRDVTESYPGQRRVAGDAGVPAVPARLPSRIRAGEAEPLARFAARALLLRALHQRSQSRRDRGGRAQGPGRGGD